MRTCLIFYYIIISHSTFYNRTVMKFMFINGSLVVFLICSCTQGRSKTSSGLEDADYEDYLLDYEDDYLDEYEYEYVMEPWEAAEYEYEPAPWIDAEYDEGAGSVTFKKPAAEKTTTPTTITPLNIANNIPTTTNNGHCVHSTLKSGARGMGPRVIGAIICGCVVIILTAIILLLICIIQKIRKADRVKILAMNA